MNIQHLLPTTIKEDALTKLNDTVSVVLSAQGLDGFKKAYLIANAASELKKALVS